MGLPGDDEGETSPTGGGGVSANSEESPSQQRLGGGGQRSWKENIPYARTGGGESPVMAPRPPFWLSALRPGPARPALPFFGARASQEAPLGVAVQLEVVGHSKTSSASFPWVPWAALGRPGKLLAIPILNTSVMVYGP